jgi:8-oxo-dGTP pyrophosphatase MutT (NUDIX family)
VIIAEHAGQFALVHSYRYPVQNWQWAFPRGFAQSASSAETAHAECVEELGSEPESLRLIGQLTPDSGLLSAVVDVFHAIVPAPTDKTADSIEIAAIRWVTLDQLEEMIAGNAIEDSFTLAALMLWHVDRGKT